MKTRRASGAVLPLIAATTLVLVLIGVAFFFMTMQVGGSRELMHATDAGSLNVAKQAMRKPDVELQSEESVNFGGLLDKGQVSLANYNRMVGQTLLVALNAQAQGTPESKANAEKLIEVLEGSHGLGARLKDALSNSSKMEGHFTAISYVNSVRMLGNEASTKCDNVAHEVAYLEAGSPSNVDVDLSTMPYTSNGGFNQINMPVGTTTKEVSKNKLAYIAGYAPIQIPGFSKAITGVPVMPGKAPHLVSGKIFTANAQAPKGCGIVPPNSFKSGGETDKMKGNACSIVGALDTHFTASIPRGYLVIHNGPSTSFDGILGDDDQIFAKELMTGIYVGPGVGTARAFTTDKDQYDAWLDYNKKRLAGVAAKEPSKRGINGDPLSITEDYVRVDWTDYQDPIKPTAASMLGAFQTAYPHRNAGTPFSSSSLTSVELFKAKVVEAFGKVTRYHDPTDPAFRQFIPAPTAVTGMKAFDHNGVYGGVITFGTTGSLKQFLGQCDPSNRLLRQIEQRLHQIKPEADSNEFGRVLNTPSIGMGQTLYIYKGLDNKLCISPSAPPWATSVSPDGRAQRVNETYFLNQKTINAATDGGAPVYPFMVAPPATGTDSCTYTPSSGYKNLLGVMNFANSTANGGTFADPN